MTTEQTLPTEPRRTEYPPSPEYIGLEMEAPDTEGAVLSAWAAPSGTAEGRVTLTLDGKPVEAVLTLKTPDVTPPTPTPPQLATFTASPNPVKPGGALLLEVGLSVAPFGQVSVIIGTPWGSSTAFVPAGSTRGTVSVAVPVGQPNGPVTLSASSGGPPITRSVTVQAEGPPIPTPTPNPPGTINVRDKGIKGDGTTADLMALQKLIDTAPENAALYFPAGAYKFNERVSFGRPGMTVKGDGPASSIQYLGGTGFRVWGLNNTFRDLRIIGSPGKTKSDGNDKIAFENLGQSARFENLTLDGPGYGIYSAGDAKGAAIKNVIINGWGVVGIFCNGGETIENCQLLQTDMSLNGHRTSHGIYIHGGASNTTVRDTVVDGARYYGCQIWGNVPGTVTQNILFERMKFVNCFSGFTIQQSQPDAARAKNVLMRDIQFTNCYNGPTFSIKQGDGIRLERVRMEGGTQGLQLGAWDPRYEVGFSITDLVVSDLYVTGHERGIWVQKSSDGVFRDVVLERSAFGTNKRNLDLEGMASVPGVTVR